MVGLGEGMKPDIMPHYPHMLQEDNEVWTAYLQEPVAPIKRVWYDVRVGYGLQLGGKASALEKKLAGTLYKKRIDVIAEVRGGFWIIEVKPYASHLALGQVVTYLDLSTSEISFPGETWAVIVCSNVDPDIISLARRLGVVLIRV